jgi:hypothetical protein
VSTINEFALTYFWLVIPVFLGITTFRIAWRQDWGWIWGLVLAGVIVGLSFVCWPWGMLGAAAIVGKLYMSYG